MSITQDGYTFPAAVHGKIQQGGPPEIGLQVTRFAGVKGESHIVSPAGGRELWVTATIRNNFTTPAAFDLALAELNQKADEPLTGRVTVSGTYAGVHDKCTFLGFFPQTPIWREPNYGWMQMGILRWRQRDPNTIPEE